MKMIFMGRKKYAANMLQWSVENGFDVKSVVTDSHCINSPTAKKACELGIPVWSLQEAENYIKENPNEIDIVISYLYWKKLKSPIIDKPTYGCINFHPAILPDWRGCAGYNIAILKKLPQWGATAHYIDENIDTGSIIKVFKFDFDYRFETAFSLEKKTQEILMELYKSVMTDVLEKGRLECQIQKKEDGTYISKQEMLDMMKIDIDNITKEELNLKIRAFWFPPYDGAGFEIDGQFYTLVNSEVLSTLNNP